MVGYKPNKAFKRDLARVAFLVCVGFSVYGALQRLLYCVPAPLNAALCVNGGSMENQGKLFFFCGKMGAG
ncbi:hypothetical protein P3589_24065, partial [Vibrio parahaemolyticus]|nr:hypothetical protein [Vibrio parahaemolyticus]